ncbi:MAG: insulinase family protein [Muribaculaceae bacterium]|nr:insulinase family protein [Muribaculaceae bacterium]
MNKELDRRVAPPVSPFGRLVLPPEKVYEANGVRLHIVADRQCPMARICILARGGKNEASSRALAEAAARVLPEGSKRFDVDRTADIIDFHGASIAGRCTDHYTRLDLTAPSRYIAELLPLLAAILEAPDFPDIRLESIKSMLAAQCAYNRSRVDDIAERNALALIAGGEHRFAQQVLPEDFAAISKDATLDYLNALLCRDNIEIFLSGGVSDSLEEGVAQIAADLPQGTSVPVHFLPFTPQEPQIKDIEVDGAEQCAVQAMIPAVPRSHPDYIPLRLAVTALGGFFGSRLMQNIREDKGLTYGISSSLCGVQEGSYVDIAAQCAPQYTGQLLDELRGELVKMATVPLTSDELLRMRLYEQTRLASVLDNAIATGDHYLTAATIGMPPGYFSEQESVTATITPDQIAEVSARYLIPDNLRIVIAGLGQC